MEIKWKKLIIGSNKNFLKLNYQKIIKNIFN